MIPETYIIETAGPEYRILKTNNVNHIYGDYLEAENCYEPDPHMFVTYLDKSIVFQSLEDAWDFLAKDTDSTNGFNLITDFKKYSYADIKSKTSS